MNNLSGAATINTVLPQIEALLNDGADQFDPVQFRFIQSMAQRINQQHGAIKQQLEKRTLVALTQYREDFSQEKEQANVLAKHALSLYPDSSDQIDNCLNCNDFSALRNLVKQLERRCNHRDNRAALVNLTNQLLTDKLTDDDKSREPTPLQSLDRQLRQQESIARESLSDGSRHTEIKGELKSVREFRDSWSKIHYQQLVDNSVNQGPKDAGPLNPERLAIRSLSAMKKLSPQYLNRFVSYVETLLWLQQIEKRNHSASRKKSSRKAALNT